MQTTPPALIVEDDEVLAQLEIRCLNRIGLKSTSVRTISEAIAYMGDFQPSMVLVDYHLPDGSADQLLSWVQANRPEVPVIVLTGRGDEQIAVRMMKQGARDYLVKDSHTMDALPEVVKRLLEAERLQRELSSVQHQYEFLVNHTQDVISVHDLSGAYVYANPAIEQVLGFSPADMIGVNAFERIHPGDLQEVLSQIAALTSAEDAGNRTAEFRIRHRDGHWIWIEATGCLTYDAEGQAQQLVVTSRDISERKRIEEERQQYTDFLEALGSISTPIPATGDAERNLQSLLDRLVRVTQVQRALLLVEEGDTLVPRLSVGMDSDLLLSYPSQYQGLPPFLNNQDQVVLLVGAQVHNCGFDLWMQPNQNGMIAVAGLRGREGFSGVLLLGATQPRPLTSGQLELVKLAATRCALMLENTQLYTRLRESEQRYRELVERATDIIWETDRHGNLDFVNQAVEQVLGYSRSILLGANYIQSLRFPDPVERMSFLRALVEGKPFDWEGTMLRPDGRPVRVSTRGHTRRGPSGEPAGLAGTTRDVTRQRQLEERMRTTQKMEAVGRLAGGIAHDFHNILTAVLGTAQILRDEAPEGSTTAEDIDTIILASRKATTLIQQLLAFGRRQSMAMVPVKLNTVIEGMVPLIRRSLVEDVEMVLELGTDLPHTQGDAGNLEQVLLNLCVNAKDAMPFGGKLLIQTRRESISAMSSNGIPAGDWVVLCVSDTGVGMSSETKQRCFEPYFSTKIESGRGSGLGLATVHGIITQHKGVIHVASEEGKGTTFEICLPVHQGVLAAEKPEAVPAQICGDQESHTVLVAEDEEPVRRLIHRILTNRGYQVLSVEDGQEAITMLRAQNGQVDLALLDTVMPRMNGIQAMQAIRREFPHVPVVMMSGYAKDVLDREAEHLQGVPFLPKPFSPDELHQRVRDILAEVRD